MTATERKWKPGDEFDLAVPCGKPQRKATIERIITLFGIRAFALHKDDGGFWRVSHIPTGLHVATGETPLRAHRAAHELVKLKGGASAIRAVVERHK